MVGVGWQGWAFHLDPRSGKAPGRGPPGQSPTSHHWPGCPQGGLSSGVPGGGRQGRWVPGGISHSVSFCKGSQVLAPTHPRPPHTEGQGGLRAGCTPLSVPTGLVPRGSQPGGLEHHSTRLLSSWEEGPFKKLSPVFRN